MLKLTESTTYQRTKAVGQTLWVRSSKKAWTEEELLIFNFNSSSEDDITEKPRVGLLGQTFRLVSRNVVVFDAVT